MERAKLYSIWIALCLCIIYMSSTLLSASTYAHERASAEKELIISDASSLVHLEETISENLFTVPSPFIELSAKPSFPLLVRARIIADKSFVGNVMPCSKAAQHHIIVSKSDNIAAQYDYSSQYYVFALRHIII